MSLTSSSTDGRYYITQLRAAKIRTELFCLCRCHCFVLRYGYREYQRVLGLLALHPRVDPALLHQVKALRETVQEYAHILEHEGALRLGGVLLFLGGLCEQQFYVLVRRRDGEAVFNDVLKCRPLGVRVGQTQQRAPVALCQTVCTQRVRARRLAA